MPPRFLQSYVTTVVSYEDRPEIDLIRQVHGTAALIGPNGQFITAAHVLREAEAACVGTGRRVGVAPMVAENGGPARTRVVPIDQSEDAAPPYDVAVFKTEYASESPLRFIPVEVGPWKDCATLGYPSQAVMPAGDRIELQARALKGYVQRTVPAGRAERPGHPDSFETSFVITRGMSGSPLFIHLGEHDALIGVCVGSIRSEIAATDVEPVALERVVRLEEYGWAHDIRALADWAPDIFGQPLGSLWG